MGETTKILLAVDDSPCTDAAVQTLIARVRPEHAEVRVLHAVEWLKNMPESFRFGVGPTAADDIDEWKRRMIHEADVLVERVSTGNQGTAQRQRPGLGYRFVTSVEQSVEEEVVDVEPRAAVAHRRGESSPRPTRAQPRVSQPATRRMRAHRGPPGAAVLALCLSGVAGAHRRRVRVGRWSHVRLVVGAEGCQRERPRVRTRRGAALSGRSASRGVGVRARARARSRLMSAPTARWRMPAPASHQAHVRRRLASRRRSTRPSGPSPSIPRADSARDGIRGPRGRAIEPRRGPRRLSPAARRSGESC